ncbi:MAG: epoxyqueuosine reductase [Desulfarculus sp.]|nr:epoxyqueuosine reductase [Desulfarculus sp.]
MNDEITAKVLDFVRAAGAVAAGVCTPETLRGGPPSTDLSYVVPGARSAVTFALPLKQDHIEPYLGKRDHQSHNRDNRDTTNLASGIAFQLAKYLDQLGWPSRAVAANNVYRPEAPGGLHDELPDISHRYLAVRSGVGWFGLSGNVIRPDTGAALVLASVVTEAELAPTPPLAPEENYCDQCGMCLAACFSGFMHESQRTSVTMGGREFSYSQRRGHVRCDYVCGGFAGLHPGGQWSTWSPSRYPIPDSEVGFQQALRLAAKAYYRRPAPAGGFYSPLLKHGKLEFTCGHCMLICHQDKQVRAKRLKILTTSGVVIEGPEGARQAVSPEKALEHLSALPSQLRTMYLPD